MRPRPLYDCNDFIEFGKLDEESRKMIKENKDDEKLHLATWRGVLGGEQKIPIVKETKRPIFSQTRNSLDKQRDVSVGSHI